jgi:hypothetical protein
VVAKEEEPVVAKEEEPVVAKETINIDLDEIRADYIDYKDIIINCNNTISDIDIKNKKLDAKLNKYCDNPNDEKKYNKCEEKIEKLDNKKDKKEAEKLKAFGVIKTKYLGIIKLGSEEVISLRETAKCLIGNDDAKAEKLLDKSDRLEAKLKHVSNNITNATDLFNGNIDKEKEKAPKEPATSKKKEKADKPISNKEKGSEGLKEPKKRGRKSTGLSDFICSKLIETDESGVGISYSSILLSVLEKYPEAKTKTTTIAWYTGSMKSGKYKPELKDSLPAKRNRSKKL